MLVQFHIFLNLLSLRQVKTGQPIGVRLFNSIELKFPCLTVTSLYYTISVKFCGTEHIPGILLLRRAKTNKQRIVRLGEAFWVKIICLE